MSARGSEFREARSPGALSTIDGESARHVADRRPRTEDRMCCGGVHFNTIPGKLFVNLRVTAAPAENLDCAGHAGVRSRAGVAEGSGLRNVRVIGRCRATMTACACAASLPRHGERLRADFRRGRWIRMGIDSGSISRSSRCFADTSFGPTPDPSIRSLRR